MPMCGGFYFFLIIPVYSNKEWNGILSARGGAGTFSTNKSLHDCYDISIILVGTSNAYYQPAVIPMKIFSSGIPIIVKYSDALLAQITYIDDNHVNVAELGSMTKGATIYGR